MKEKGTVSSATTRDAATGSFDEVFDLIDAVDAQVVREQRRHHRAAHRNAAAVDRRKAQAERRPLRVLAVLVAVLATLVGLQAGGAGPFPRPGRDVPAEEMRRALMGGLSFAVRLIEAHRDRAGELPSDLSAVGLSRRFGWSYEALSSDRYRVSLEVGGDRESYDSILDADTFFADVREPRGD